MIPTLPASTRTRTLTNPVAKFQYPIASHAVNTLFPDLVINREFYFSCILGDGTNQETCEGSGCCWWPLEEGSDEPWCYTPSLPPPPASAAHRRMPGKANNGHVQKLKIDPCVQLPFDKLWKGVVKGRREGPVVFDESTISASQSSFFDSYGLRKIETICDAAALSERCS